MAKSCSIKQSLLGDECDSISNVKKRLIEEARKKVIKEFDRRYHVSLEDLKTRLEKKLKEIEGPDFFEMFDL